MFSLFKKKKPNGLTALPVKELLAPYTNLLELIHQQVGVPETHWKALYVQFIENFAEQVQLLPASESHHHSGAGGLLTHSLEVGLNALKIRKGRMLPVGASSEVIEEQKELWSYAIFTAAMLHDIGKPLTDQIITIISEEPKRILTPLTEKIPVKAIYRIEFRRGRKYRSHENVALLLASKIIPSPGLDWITSNNDVLDDWSFCLTGRKHEANTLGELVTHADQLSTAQNLTGAENTPLPSSKSIPLAKRLRTALIYLIDEGTNIPLNRSGAAGWVYDDKLWLVSKRVLDELKKQMIEEGQTGIPSDNTRLMDELMQNNIIIASEPDRAIWKMTVHVDTWKNNFTCLCFPMNKLWSDQTAWPAQPENVKVLKTTNENDSKEKNTPKHIEIQTDTGEEDPTPSETNNNDGVSNEKLDKPTNTSPLLDLPTPPGISIPVDDSSKKKKSANKVKETDAPDTSTPEVASNNFEVKVKSKSNDGQDFVDWFSSGIADGSMPINVSGALVHTVGDEKSLLLVSPLIFRKFAKSRHSISFEQLQRDFQNLNIHKVTPKDTNIWKFKTISDRKNKKSNILSGMLIEDPEEKLKIRLPTSNTHLIST
ncbi:MAG: TraI domain-containing protein [Methylococcaceae bacterium]|nr:TraI domain-containing protein [Methylococcaceae bacterium]